MAIEQEVAEVGGGSKMVLIPAACAKEHKTRVGSKVKIVFPDEPGYNSPVPCPLALRLSPEKCRAAASMGLTLQIKELTPNVADLQDSYDRFGSRGAELGRTKAYLEELVCQKAVLDGLEAEEKASKFAEVERNRPPPTPQPEPSEIEALEAQATRLENLDGVVLFQNGGAVRVACQVMKIREKIERLKGAGA